MKKTPGAHADALPVDSEELRREHIYGTFPLLESERKWSGWDFTWVNTALAIATWAFLVGGSTALLVGFKDGIAAMLIGNAIGLCFMVLAAVPASQRYGTEQYTLLRGAFGVVGVGAIVFTIILITEMGWSSLLAVMAGRATNEVAGSITGAEMNQYGPIVTVGALAAILISWFVLSRGPVVIGRLNKIVAPGLVIITIAMMIVLVSATSWDTLLSAAPLAPFDDETLNFMVAVEFNVGVGVSWYPVMGSLSRMTRHRKAALWPAYGGLLVATLIAQVVGMAAALTIGDSDPTIWMVPFGGPVLGVAVLAFIAFANITSMSSIVYSTILALRQSSGRLLARVPWKLLTAAFFILPAIMSFFPQFMYEQFMTFVLLSGAFLTSICGVALTDYFFLRRQSIDLRQLHLANRGQLYAFAGGVNWAGLAAVLIGAVFYLWLYNPITLETAAVFSIVTASLPAALVAAVAYLVLFHLLYRRRPTRPSPLQEA
ncbi:thiamine permease [Nesterenkonia sp. AN1]|uniref:NCS1 family nucleobase:cation symporter-1 n=1 Tax=Nesterenkonia aurantiaca TaxID=1436010 RepID=A0A4R7G6N5_9MICC|nr:MULTISPECIES: cytosine permease [Nesterenkonia]EXF23933.1 thiamine permease [Nesterenkonia sp. AN1]TDS86966.1 NCS1 family nucleobase:cation symporter-1 [Nesterenkonia aurantiaca]